MIVYLIFDFPAVEEIEYLHHDEGVEDEGEMSGVDFCLLIDCMIIFVAWDCVITAAADSASLHSVVPFPGGVGGELCLIIGIGIFWNKFFSPEN